MVLVVTVCVCVCASVCVCVCVCLWLHHGMCARNTRLQCMRMHAYMLPHDAMPAERESEKESQNHANITECECAIESRDNSKSVKSPAGDNSKRVEGPAMYDTY